MVGVDVIVGVVVGKFVGAIVGVKVGAPVGSGVIPSVGDLVGIVVGIFVGAMVGRGEMVGELVKLILNSATQNLSSSKLNPMYRSSETGFLGSANLGDLRASVSHTERRISTLLRDHIALKLGFLLIDMRQVYR
jgi:uncharacterized protein YcfJ